MNELFAPYGFSEVNAYKRISEKWIDSNPTIVIKIEKNYRIFYFVPVSSGDIDKVEVMEEFEFMKKFSLNPY